MNAMKFILLSPIVERLGWGLLNFLWQGAAIAALWPWRLDPAQPFAQRPLPGRLAGAAGHGLPGAGNRVAHHGISRPRPDARQGGNGPCGAAGRNIGGAARRNIDKVDGPAADRLGAELAAA